MYSINSVSILPLADCGDPGAAENGMRLLLNTTAGANVTYLCDDGFSAIGSTILECQYNGEWSRPPPTCQGMDISTAKEMILLLHIGMCGMVFCRVSGFAG